MLDIYEFYGKIFWHKYVNSLKFLPNKIIFFQNINNKNNTSHINKCINLIKKNILLLFIFIL